MGGSLPPAPARLRAHAQSLSSAGRNHRGQSLPGDAMAQRQLHRLVQSTPPARGPLVPGSFQVRHRRTGDVGLGLKSLYALEPGAGAPPRTGQSGPTTTTAGNEPETFTAISAAAVETSALLPLEFLRYARYAKAPGWLCCGAVLSFGGGRPEQKR